VKTGSLSCAHERPGPDRSGHNPAAFAAAEPGYWGQLRAASAQFDFAEGRNETAIASARTAIEDLGGPDYMTALLQARLYQALGREQPRQGALARARQLAGAACPRRR
jgi:hypothetical protein